MEIELLFGMSRCFSVTNCVSGIYMMLERKGNWNDHQMIKWPQNSICHGCYSLLPHRREEDLLERAAVHCLG